MKTHFLLGFLIGAAINLACQWTDTTAHLNFLELATCATVAALAAVTAALRQCRKPPFPSNRPATVTKS